MVIRQLRNEDIPQAMKLKISCWTEELAGQAENTLDLQEEIDFWTTWVNTPDVHNDIRVFVGAFDGDALLGVAAGSFVHAKDAPEDGIELNGLWISPKHRGKGISLKLILHVLDAFIPFGVNRMEVYNLHHAPSNAFYRKFGGSVVGTEHPMDGKLAVDVFEFDVPELKTRLEKALSRYF